MAKTFKIKEYKLSSDENLKAYSKMEDFVVHISGFNRQGHRMDAYVGHGIETLYSNYCDFNRYGTFASQDALQRKAEGIYNSIKNGMKEPEGEVSTRA